MESPNLDLRTTMFLDFYKKNKNVADEIFNYIIESQESLLMAEFSAKWSTEMHRSLCNSVSSLKISYKFFKDKAR